jgi:hypothetical protein
VKEKSFSDEHRAPKQIFHFYKLAEGKSADEEMGEEESIFGVKLLTIFPGLFSSLAGENFAVGNYVSSASSFVLFLVRTESLACAFF